jgi:hypothetical protein
MSDPSNSTPNQGSRCLLDIRPKHFKTIVSAVVSAHFYSF